MERFLAHLGDRFVGIHDSEASRAFITYCVTLAVTGLLAIAFDTLRVLALGSMVAVEWLILAWAYIIAAGVIVILAISGAQYVALRLNQHTRKRVSYESLISPAAHLGVHLIVISLGLKFLVPLLRVVLNVGPAQATMLFLVSIALYVVQILLVIYLLRVYVRHLAAKLKISESHALLSSMVFIAPVLFILLGIGIFGEGIFSLV